MWKPKYECKGQCGVVSIGFVASHHMVKTDYSCEQTVQVLMCNAINPTFATFEEQV